MKGRVERTRPSGSQMREDGLESAWVTVSSRARERFGGMPGAFGVGGKWISGRGTLRGKESGRKVARGTLTEGVGAWFGRS